jgi:3'(2'), 5'-bisphosphate nucleotidase
VSVSEAELDALVAVARRAAKLVLSLYREHCASGIEVQHKGPADPVTRADREADALIGELLAARFPDAAIISEEGANDDAALERALLHERVLWVDPLDGTTEFVARRGEFAVMIGLAEEGRAVAGAMVIPTEGMTLAGALGRGAWYEIDGEARRPLAVSRCKTFSESRMMVSRAHPPPLIEPLRRRLGIASLEPCGSAGVKVARIALGRAELYVHDGPGTKRWDSCAPEAILQAAGGRVSDLTGAPLEYATRELGLAGGLAASNGVLHAGLLSAVEWARRHAAT